MTYEIHKEISGSIFSFISLSFSVDIPIFIIYIYHLVLLSSSDMNRAFIIFGNIFNK